MGNYFYVECFYVARDANGELLLYTGKPLKGKDIWCGDNIALVNPDSFPNVKWEDDEPTPVVLQQAVFKSKESKENGNNQRRENKTKKEIWM